MGVTDQPGSHGSGLTDADRAWLIESGALTPERLAAAEAMVARGELAELERRTRQEALDATWGTAEVTEWLGITSAEMERRLAAGELFAVVVGDVQRFPTWQFTNEPEQPTLPALAQVVRAFDDDRDLVSVLGFMTTPQEDLVVDGHRLTPPEWLAAGGDPQEVVDILDSFLMT